MDSTEVEKIVKQYIKDNLKVRVEKEWGYYQEDPDIIVKLILDGKIISEARY